MALPGTLGAICPGQGGQAVGFLQRWPAPDRIRPPARRRRPQGAGLAVRM